MKTFTWLTTAALILGISSCGEPSTESKSSGDSIPANTTDVKPDYSFLLSKEHPAYDSALAAAVGADEYGMKQYVLAYLKAGPNRNQDSATRAELQKAHLQNIMRMAEEGKLVVAGPFMDDTDVKGIYIFNVATIEEAKALTETDPAIKAGRLEMELHPWYGSAALVMLNNLHYALEKKSVAE